jgi:hypothetical protein
VGKSEGKRPLGRPRRRWVNNNEMDLRKIGWGGVDWIGLVQDMEQWRAVVNTVMNMVTSQEGFSSAELVMSCEILNWISYGRNWSCPDLKLSCISP